MSRMIGVRLRSIAVFGPATVVSVAYMDPGNFGSNIAAGSTYGLALLWVVWLSGVMAMVFQYLSGKLGLVTGTAPADYVFERLRGIGGIPGRAVRAMYFAGLFVMVLATDMAEFLGIAVGLSLLLSLPLLLTVWISIIDVLILMLYADTLRRLERVIGLLVLVIGASYVYELYVVGTDPVEVLARSFVPTLEERGQVLLVASIIGATVMPHAVLLHAYLTRDRWGPRQDARPILRRHLKETIVFLSVASLINVSLQVMSYYAFYRNGYIGIEELEDAYLTLAPLYGAAASIVFAVAVLASGISSSIVSVMAGVYLVESFLGRRLEAWKVRLGVRLINMLPLAVAVYLGIGTIDILVYSQVVLSLTLPLVLIPLLFAIRGLGMAVGRPLMAAAVAFTGIILTVNAMLFI